MKWHHGWLYLIGLSVAIGLCLAPATVTAQDVAWDMVSSTSHNLLSYTTDAPPVWTALGDGFQKYRVGVDNIPYALVDDTASVYPADQIGIIDSATDFDDFFGICDIVNDDNSGPLHATWVFDISSANANPKLWVSLAAMGDFEVETPDVVGDVYSWSYQVDSGPVVTAIEAGANEDGSMTYTMADGTVRVVDDPLVANGVTLFNGFQSFEIPITQGSQLTVVLTALTDGGSEGYAARNIVITSDPPPAPPAVVVQTQSATDATGIATAGFGIASLVLSEATNVNFATSGAVGATEWTWQLTLVDPTVSGSATIVVTDLNGDTGSATVNLSGTSLSIVLQYLGNDEASGIATADAGIASLVLTESTNLSLTTTGAVGDTQWTWQVTLIDPAQAGSGTLVLTDVLGNTAVLALFLQGPGLTIPVLGTGGLVLLALLLAGAGFVALRFGLR